MGKRAQTTTKDFIKSIPVPTSTETYTGIGHGFVIDKTIEQLATAGFAIERELYRCAKGGDVAQGIYHLNYGGDPEMGMMFAWSNSYDKSMRFRCAVGGYVLCCLNGIVSGNMGSWARRHVGDADQQTVQVIEHQVMNADQYYKQLVSDKTQMKEVIVTKKRMAEVLGRVFFEHSYLTTEQVSIVRQQIKEPKFDYNADKDSLWSMYNHITYSLQKAHPSFWLDQQRLIHGFLCEEFAIEGIIDMTPKETNQMSIYDVSGVDPETVISQTDESQSIDQ